MNRLKQYFFLMKQVQQRYVADGCSHSAAALTYMSLFAVVPLMTVMYTMLSVFPTFQEIGLQAQEYIFNNFVPSTGKEVQRYLEQFSQQARTLTGVGIIFLGVTALLMLKNIEKTFNAIWRTRENRKGLSSFLLYWAILSLGPLCIGLALAISTYLVSLKVIMDQVDIFHIGPMLLHMTPYLLTGAAFTLLFAAVPNCRVPFKHALSGGFLTAFVFELAKQFFTVIVANTSFQLIYGTFAAIPLFLLWIYLSWLIVLAGAEFTHALCDIRSNNSHNQSELTLTLALLELLWSNYQNANSVKEQQILRSPWLFGEYSIDSEQWTSIRNKLLEAKLLGVTQAGHYVLGRDLNHVSLWDLLQLLGYYQNDDANTGKTLPYWFKHYQQCLTSIQTHNQQIFSIPLSQLFSLTSAQSTCVPSEIKANTGNTQC